MHTVLASILDIRVNSSHMEKWEDYEDPRFTIEGPHRGIPLPTTSNTWEIVFVVDDGK